MKKALLFSAIALAACAPAKAAEAKTYPVPIERRVPWTIITGTDSEGSENNPLGGETGGIYDLIDRNPITFWHSNPKQCNGQKADHSHWFMIDRGVGAPTFNKLSIQQRVIQIADETQASWNGAVTEADIYVTDDFIGLTGGFENQAEDDKVLYDYLQSQPGPTLTIKPEIYVQEAQIFDFKEDQSGRFVLVVIKHAVNPNKGSQTDDEKYACLSEFNLFYNTTVEESDFPAPYSLGTNPDNTQSNTRRTHSLAFSDSFTEVFRYSPMLQSKQGQEPYITYLNWLDWKGTYFDITPLMTVSAALGENFQIQPDAAGTGMLQYLYIDWDNDGFTAEKDLVHQTDEAADLNSYFEAPIDETVKPGTYRARYMVDAEGSKPDAPTAKIANGGIVVDFMVKIERPVTFNVVLTYGGKVIGTFKNVEGFINEPFTVPSPDFFDIDVVAKAPENNGATITLEIVRFIGLPFAFTETTDNLKWQAIQQNYDYKTGGVKDYNGHTDFTWTYNPDKPEELVSFEPSNVKTEGFDDNQLWAFVGNVAEGFRIYNKAAGLDKWIYADGNSVKIGSQSKQDYWKPYYAKNRSHYKYCVFKTEGTEYICYPNPASAGLTFSRDADDSATCWFLGASEPMLAQVAEYNFSYEESDDPYFPKVKPVGSFDYNGTEFPESEEVIAAAQNDKYDYDASVALRQLIDKFETNVNYVSLDPAKWYRIASANGVNENGQNTGFGNNYLFTGADDEYIYSQEILATRKHNYHSLFHFTPTEDDENAYVIESQGKYLGTPSSNKIIQQVDDLEDAAHYQLYQIDAPAQFAIGAGFSSPTENKFIHQGSAGSTAPIALTGWGAGSGGSHFYIIPANDIEVLMTETLDDAKVGFGYFPFAVSALTEGTKLYYISHEIDSTTTEGEDKHVAAYVEVSSVPAYTAFMVTNDSAEKVSLKIESEEAEVETQEDETTEEPATVEPANHLTGSLRATTAAAGDYVLGKDADGNVAFVKSTEATDVNGNSVYMPAANVDSEAGDILPIQAHIEKAPVEDGISSVTAVKSESVYDLQGRRLTTPVKGVNIVNGKKVIVK